MGDGDYDDDEVTPRRPPAPADRTWVHPSEAAAAARRAHRRAQRRLWGVGLSSGIGGAMVVAALWYLNDAGPDVQVVTQRVAATPVESVAPRVTPADEWATEVTTEVRRATAMVQSADGTQVVASAVAVHDEGYLLTSGEALEGATDVTLHTHDGETVEATVLGHDSETGLTVLKVSETVDIANVAGDEVQSGDVVALVDPTGTATRQVIDDVAAVGTATDGEQLVGYTSLDETTDDPPPGSPVVDATGAVVGVTAATEASSPLIVVPIDVANTVAEAIITDGEARHAWLGVSANNGARGAVIAEVTPDGPAHLAGVQPGDLLVSLDGDAVASAVEMVAKLRYHEVGSSVGVTVERGEETVELTVVLGEEPGD